MSKTVISVHIVLAPFVVVGTRDQEFLGKSRGVYYYRPVRIQCR